MIVDTNTSQAHEANYDEIEAWLIERFATLAGQAPDDIGVDRPFADYQMDSSVAVTLTQELGRWLGRKLSITLLWEYPSIGELASALSAEPADDPEGSA